MTTNHKDQTRVVYYGGGLSQRAILHSLEELDESCHVTTWCGETGVPEDRLWAKIVAFLIFDFFPEKSVKSYRSLYLTRREYDHPFLIVATVPGHPELTRWSAPLSLEPVIVALRGDGGYGEEAIAKLLNLPRTGR